MTELRGEPAHPSLWSSYGGSSHLPSRLGSTMEPAYPSSSTASSSHAGRPRSDHTDHPSYSYSRYSQDEPETYERQPPPTLPSHHGFPNLKRSFSQTESSAYQEMVQDLRDDGSRLTVNHDQKLLAFRRSQDKHTIVDQHGRMQPLELSAQLHGMFFLSEMPSNTSDGTVLQPELTCYRRNLFQISGSLVMPRGPLSVVNESGESLAVSNMEVTISAIESVDGNPVRLIVIPWKTPPPNSTDTSQSPDQEPPSLPLIPFQEDGAEPEGDYAVYPIDNCSATANNGRRKELQQHFVLHLKVFGTLSSGAKAVLAETITAPIVVRGRSPRNFQTRKEIPLLGSSAGSRGQALMETGMGVIAGTLSAKQPESKPANVDLQLPRATFTFSSPKTSGLQLSSLRSNTYPNWTAPSAASMAQLPSSSTTGSYPSTTLGPDPFPKVPLSGGPSFTAEPQELPLPTSIAPPMQLSLTSTDHPQPSLRSPYTYVHATSAPAQMSITAPALSGSDSALSVPRYVDNPRPAKSPRHSNQQSVHGSDPASTNESSPEYRYGSYSTVTNSSGDVSGSTNYHSETPSANPAPPPARDYYPSPNTWTTNGGEHGSSAAYAGGHSRSYSFSQDHFKSETTTAPPVKAEPTHPTPPPGYNNGPRGSFDGLNNNYSWSGS
ncbi:hypothetical protein S40288_01439 [Stachybotrys chartarum IBT 40288]|nr:hypothetical protein S40288_01439 [Stachybotrys chartarum IBT 40288]